MLTGIISVFANFFHLILGINTPRSFPPPLSPKQEEELFALVERGDEEARKKLILHNLRLVSHIVRKYYASSKNQEDLVSIGTIGLIKAVDTFKAANGAKFATYAARCIQNEILMHFRSQKKQASEISLNDTIDVDRDGNPLTYIDVICSDEDVSEEIDRKIVTEKMLRAIESQLSPRERQIVMMRYGIGGTRPQTQREIATSLSISRSYVSRIEKGALEKLKAALEG